MKSCFIIAALVVLSVPARAAEAWPAHALMLDKLQKAGSLTHRYFAVATLKESKNEWLEFPSGDAMAEASPLDGGFEMADGSFQDGRLRILSYSYMDPGGDNAWDIYYYFDSEGRTRRAKHEFRSFFWDGLVVSRLYDIDASCNLTLVKESFLTLRDRKPRKRPDDFQGGAPGIECSIKQLPIAGLLDASNQPLHPDALTRAGERRRYKA